MTQADISSESETSGSEMSESETNESEASFEDDDCQKETSAVVPETRDAEGITSTIAALQPPWHGSAELEAGPDWVESGSTEPSWTVPDLPLTSLSDPLDTNPVSQQISREWVDLRASLAHETAAEERLCRPDLAISESAPPSKKRLIVRRTQQEDDETGLQSEPPSKPLPQPLSRPVSQLSQPVSKPRSEPLSDLPSEPLLEPLSPRTPSTTVVEELFGRDFGTAATFSPRIGTSAVTDRSPVQQHNSRMHNSGFRVTNVKV